MRLGEEAARAALCQLNGRQWHESIFGQIQSELLGRLGVDLWADLGLGAQLGGGRLRGCGSASVGLGVVVLGSEGP